MILKAAIKLLDGSVFTGKRHHHCFETMAEFYFPGNTWNSTPQNKDKWYDITRDCEQGFVTHTGQFVSRVEAYHIASHSRQIIPEEEKLCSKSKILFSEDIY